MARELSKLNPDVDEAYSSGTVQDFHLIPFSSVSSLLEVAEQDNAKIQNSEAKCKRNGENFQDGWKIFMVFRKSRRERFRVLS